MLYEREEMCVQLYRKFFHILIFAVFLLLFLSVKDRLFIVPPNIDVSQPIHNTSTIDEPLYKEIMKKSEEFYEEPEDAYIDRVWKKTPGRNGLQVDLEKSYEKMKKGKEFKKSLLSFEQIPPDISLNDLEPAPIFRGHPDKEMVSLLINVSWGTEYIPEILEILHKEKVKATFFIEGKWAKEHTNLVQMIDEQGHLIGNHAYDHPNMKQLTNEENTVQMTQTNDIIEAIIGKEPQWFAPPSGSMTDEVVEIAHHLNMETILWTVDTIDWKKPSVSVMINRVMTKIHPGATVLMHPTLPVVKGLKEMIGELKDKGYRIGTIEALLSEER